MHTLYATFRQIQNSRYTSVNTLDKIFLDETHAKEYVKLHNEQHPSDVLIIKEVDITDAEKSFTVKPLTLLAGTFTLTEEGIVKEAFEETKENSVELSPQQVAHVSFNRSTIMTLGSFKTKEEKKLSFEKQVEPIMKTHYNYTLHTAIADKQSLIEAKEDMRKRVIVIHQNTIRYQKGMPFLTDHTLENWLNDPDFSLEYEQQLVLTKLQTFIKQAKTDA